MKKYYKKRKRGYILLLNVLIMAVILAIVVLSGTVLGLSTYL